MEGGGRSIEEALGAMVAFVIVVSGVVASLVVVPVVWVVFVLVTGCNVVQKAIRQGGTALWLWAVPPLSDKS